MLFRIGTLYWLVSETAIIICAAFSLGAVIVSAQWFQYIPMLMREQSLDNIFLVASNGALTIFIFGIFAYQFARKTLLIRRRQWKLPFGKWRPILGEEGQLIVDLRPEVENRTVRLVTSTQSDRRVGRVQTSSLAIAQKWQYCIQSAT